MRGRCLTAVVWLALACSESRSPAAEGSDAGARDAARASPAAESRPWVLSPASSLRDALPGHWLGELTNADCVTVGDWFSFVPNGDATHWMHLSSECSNLSTWLDDHGEYALGGRTLMTDFSHPPIDDPNDGVSLQIIEVVRRVERMTIAIGERPASAELPAVTFLDDRAFSSDDGTRFASLRSLEQLTPRGLPLESEEVELVLQLNPGLQAAEVATALQVELHASLREQVSNGEGERRDEIAFTFPARIREEHGLRRIMPEALDGLDDDDALAAWQTVLDDAGIQAHPEWARRMFDRHYFPSQRYQPDDVTVLGSTLPERARWLRSADPPPVPPDLD